MLLTLLFIGCGSETSNITAIPKLLDSLGVVDAGAVAPPQRQRFVVPLFSTGEADLDIYAIEVHDLATDAISTTFEIQDGWADADCLEEIDGIDCAQLTEYDDESDEDTLLVDMYFQPATEGFFEAVMYIWSNDNQHEDTKQPLPSNPDGNTFAVWQVQLRGVGRQPCANVVPAFVDFGLKAVGGDYPADSVGPAIEIRNCGVVKVEVTAGAFPSTDSAFGSVTLRSLPPIYVLPAGAEVIDVGWQVGSEAAISGDMGFVTNGDPGALYQKTLHVIGNNCEESGSRSFDADQDGWLSCGGDCNDDDATINPSLSERPDSGVDEDCDGAIDEESNSASTDDDLDGCAENGSGCTTDYDCDDADPLIGPGNVEAENNVDDNCDGRIDETTIRYDDDSDGWSERQGDCDDSTSLINPDAVEAENGVDDDCDGVLDEGGKAVDDDLDLLSDDAGDCDDGDPWTYPGAREYCDDVDNDCDGEADEGEDGTIEGACPAEASGSTTTATQREGCNSGGRGAAWLGLLGLPLLRRRRG